MVRNSHLFNDVLPVEVVENINVFFPEYDDLNYEEFVQHQEGVYQSLKGSFKNKELRSNYGQSSAGSQHSGQGQGGESSNSGSFDSQLALDEALARSLQELEEEFDDLDISQSSSIGTENRGFSNRRAPATRAGEDDIDPDNMTYEQLQNLGESIGSESKGLSAELISRLPTFKYKTGLFSKKKDNHECVICFNGFKNGEYLITMPCAHQYHSECIAQWLKLKKHCPICQKEVTDD